MTYTLNTVPWKFTINTYCEHLLVEMNSVFAAKLFRVRNNRIDIQTTRRELFFFNELWYVGARER